MKRLYYLTSHIDSVDSSSASLRDAGIKHWNFHVLSKDKAGLSTHHIHSTTPFHERDFIRSGERGALIGAVLGTVGAIMLLGFDVVSATTMGYVAMFAFFMVCTLHGAWSGGLFGIQKENYKVRKFHKMLENGQYLLMIDVKPRDEASIRDLMSQHPQLMPVGEDTTTITPFNKKQAA